MVKKYSLNDIKGLLTSQQYFRCGSAAIHASFKFPVIKNNIIGHWSIQPLIKLFDDPTIIKEKLSKH